MILGSAMAIVFQSTLSMRRATLHVTRTLRCVRISIHALHEESDSSIFPTVRVGWISIHALHEESDLITSSAVQTSRKISIHALHEESDCHCPKD